MREWARYKRSTELSGQLLLDQLHGCCSTPLRLDMASEVGDELDNMQEDRLLKTMRRMAVKETNPMVHRNKLRSMLQGETERYRNYVSRLKEASIDCLYNVSCGDHDEEKVVSYREEMVRDQAIYGMYDKDIQAKILAKGSKLLGLEAVVTQAEAEEQAKVTQSKLGRGSDEGLVEVNKVSDYKKSKMEEGQTDVDDASCHFCGVKGHGKYPAREVREKSCAAWNKDCRSCGRIGHFASVCKRPKSDPRGPGKPGTNCVIDKTGAFMNSIAGVHGSHNKIRLDHVEWSRELGWRKTAPANMPRVAMDIRVLKQEQQFMTHLKELRTHRVGRTQGWQCTPDTGAQITLSGVALLSRLNIGRRHLIPVSQEVEAANSHGIKILGAVLLSLVNGDTSERETRQLCYISEQCKGLFLSLSACKDLGIVSRDFPTPVAPPPPPGQSQEGAQVMVCATPRFTGQAVKRAECGCPMRSSPPTPLTQLPPGLTSQRQMQDWILKEYASSAFNVCEHQPLPSMHGEPLNIVLQPSAKPVAYHIPTPVPIFWQERVKADLDRDVRKRFQ